MKTKLKTRSTATPVDAKSVGEAEAVAAKTAKPAAKMPKELPFETIFRKLRFKQGDMSGTAPALSDSERKLIEPSAIIEALVGARVEHLVRLTEERMDVAVHLLLGGSPAERVKKLAQSFDLILLSVLARDAELQHPHLPWPSDGQTQAVLWLEREARTARNSNRGACWTLPQARAFVLSRNFEQAVRAGVALRESAVRF